MSLIIIVNETFITRKLHEVHGGVSFLWLFDRTFRTNE